MSGNHASSRRQFLGSAGLGTAGSLAASGPGEREQKRLPREVWVASVGQMGLAAQTPQEMCRKMLSRMEETVPLQPDIICTPEVFPFTGLPAGARRPVAEVAEQREGPVLEMFSEFARRYRCYVICSTYTKEAGLCYIASVLLDRMGKYAGEYRKTNPTNDELELGITPGPLNQPVFRTDFGTIGIQICYDINWYENWDRLGRAGAEIVFWPSAFGGGKMLNSLAWMNKYFVVSSTRFDHPTKIVDPLGDDVVATGRAGNWICEPVNLDIAVVQSVAHFRKFKDIRKKYGRRFRFRILHVEALATIEGLSGDVSVPEVLQEFGIPTARQMLADSTRRQNVRRPA